MLRICRLLLGVAALILVSGCFVPISTPGDAIEIVVNETGYGFEATLSFGAVDIESGASELTGLVMNISETDVTVTALTTEEPFSLEAPPLPFTVSAGGSVAVSLSFDPDYLGAVTLPLNVTIDAVDTPFMLNLAGTGTSAAANVMKLTIGSTDYPCDSSYSCPDAVDPDLAALETAIQLVNMSDGPLTVTGVSGAAEGLSLLFAAAPFTVAAGDVAAGSLVFQPSATGAAAASFNITVEGGTAPFVFNAAGVGDQAPEVEVIVTVTGDIPPTQMGDYQLSTTPTPEGFRVYWHPDNTYAIYAVDAEGYPRWCFDDDANNSNGVVADYDDGSAGLGAPSLSMGDWNPVTGSGPETIGEIDTPTAQVIEGDTVSAHYRFADEENDLEGATEYQWYRSVDPLGDYTPIAGAEAQAKDYLTTIDDLNCYLKVLVTPVAATGTSRGEPVMLGPCASVQAPPPPM